MLCEGIIVGLFGKGLARKILESFNFMMVTATILNISDGDGLCFVEGSLKPAQRLQHERFSASGRAWAQSRGRQCACVKVCT